MNKRIGGLIPDHALGRMPGEVRAAQATAVEAAEALARGENRAAEARAKAQAAPADDAKRLAAAARSGAKAPAAKAAELAREADAAARGAEVLRADRRRALQALQAAVVDHLPACMEAQNATVLALKEKAAEPLDALAETVAELEREAALLKALAATDAYRIIKGKKRPRGAVNFTRVDRRELDAGALVERARAAVDVLGSEVTVTAAGRQAAEEAKDAERRAHTGRERALARGGVFAG